MTMKNFFFCLAVMGLFFASCKSPLLDSFDNSESGKGSLSVSISNYQGARTIVPGAGDIAMTSYDIIVSRSGYTDKTATFSALTGVIPGLEPGNWTITVNGKTAAGIIIATGSSPVEIVSSETTSASVSLAYTGADATNKGSIAITLLFPKSIGITDVDASLGGVAISPALTVADNGDTNNKVVYAAADIATFDPLLRISLKKAGVVVLSWAEIVWVYKNITTTKTDTLLASAFSAAPAVPASLTATLQASGTVDLSWPSVSTAESYSLERSTDGTNYSVLASAVAAGTTSYADSTAVPGTSCTYRISASNDFGTSGYTLTAASTAIPYSFVMSGTGTSAGDNQSFTKGSLVFNMKYIPGETFPVGLTDAATVTLSSPYWMSETEVTYELWNAVRTWATTTGGYTFANAGVQGDSGAGTNQHPVTTINWRDSMVWCNALTEYYNANNGTDTDLDCVYYTDSGYTTPIKAATDSATITWDAGSAYSGTEDEPYVKSTAKGFRLPGSMEWECAARYIDGSAWTAGSMASGGTVAYTGTPATDYPNFSPFAWYGNNTTYTTGNTTTTQPVAGKTANALGIRDMSGNLWEWCFEWHPSVGDLRVIRGGSWFLDASFLQVGGVHGDHPYTGNNLIGFRFARTIVSIDEPLTEVNIAAIPGVTAPVAGATPVITITATDQYTGTVTWSDSPVTFAACTVYTATITLTAKSGYTLTGVAADFFTVTGATSDTNPADSGVVTAVFPATGAPPAGANLAYTLPSSISFNMKYVPGGAFPTGLSDTGTPYTSPQTISTPYWMAETEVTYELWNAVRTWATTTGGYTFANAGVQGNSGAGTNQHPVTTINWRDSMVWCNALTEYYNANNGTDADLDLVYYTDGGYTTPHRSSADGTYGSSVNATTGSFDDPYVKAAAKGFRLSGSLEWECAARYKDGSAWTAGSWASGGTGAYTSTAVTDYPNFSPFAWYGNNTVSPTGNTITTQPVAGKTANALGIRDISGNVWEWCFDWHPSNVGSSRVRRGGSWDNDASFLRVGAVYSRDPYGVDGNIGFRFARTQ